MALINPSKQYKKFISFGCSFTNYTEKEKSWGYYVAKLLNCEFARHNTSGSSNPMILNHLVNYCETNDMTDCCVGIQWSEYTRREFWMNKYEIYNTFNAGIFEDKNRKYMEEDVKILSDYRELFYGVWFDEKEMILRTINSMFLLISYLKGKGIDYIMFEGLNSVLDSYHPDDEIKQKLNDGNAPFQKLDLILLLDEHKEKIFNQPTMFKKYGDMMRFMNKHPLFDPNAFDGHPNRAFSEWWANEMVEYCKEYYSIN
jgi:hypothetical protein